MAPAKDADARRVQERLGFDKPVARRQNVVPARRRARKPAPRVFVPSSRLGRNVQAKKTTGLPNALRAVGLLSCAGGVLASRTLIDVGEITPLLVPQQVIDLLDNHVVEMAAFLARRRPWLRRCIRLLRGQRDDRPKRRQNRQLPSHSRQCNRCGERAAPTDGGKAPETASQPASHGRGVVRTATTSASLATPARTRDWSSTSKYGSLPLRWRITMFISR
jgi:hypothetical protein